MVVKFNSQQKIVAVLAVRAGSQRVPEKNIRKFHDTNLLELKLNVLTRCKQIDEIVVNSDSEEMLEIGRKFNVSTIVFSTSGITLTSATLTPIELSQIAKVDVFVSWVLPDKISLPIIKIDALTFAFFSI